MNKTVSVITLGEADEARAQALLQSAASSIGDFSLIRAENCSDFSDSAANAKADIIFAAAEIPQFLKAKFHLIKALSCGAVRSSAIAAAMGENAPADKREAELQAAIPQKARAYFTLDGLYSAFALKRENGSLLIFLPLEYDRLRQLFAGGLGIFRKKENDEKPLNGGFRQDIKEFIASGKTAVITDYGFSKALINVLSRFENNEYAFMISAESNPSKAKLTLAEAAGKAAASSQADFAIGISEILTEEGSGALYVEVCVAIAQRAQVAKVFAEENEDSKALVGAALTKLFSMMNSIAKSGLNPEKPASPPAVSEKKKKPLVPLILALSGVCAATVISLIIALTD